MTFSKGWLKSPLLKASENEASNAQPNRVLAPSKVKGISKKRQPDKASLEGQMVKDVSGGEKGRRVSKSGVNGRGKKQGGDNIAQDQSDRGSQAGKAKRGRRGGSSQQGNGVEEEEEDSRAGLEWGEKETNAQGTDEGADEEEEDDEGDNDDSGPGVRSGKGQHSARGASGVRGGGDEMEDSAGSRKRDSKKAGAKGVCMHCKKKTGPGGAAMKLFHCSCGNEFHHLCAGNLGHDNMSSCMNCAN